MLFQMHQHSAGRCHHVSGYVRAIYWQRNKFCTTESGKYTEYNELSLIFLIIFMIKKKIRHYFSVYLLIYLYTVGAVYCNHR